jgi:hypothetical protein
MSEEKNQNASGRSWRTIRQEVAPRAMSSKGRRSRQLAALRILFATALLGGLAWGAYEIVQAWDGSRSGLATTVQGDPLRRIIVESDGVLTDPAWVRRTLRLPGQTALLDLDLTELSARLTANRQVRVAVLTRRFPDTLVVSLNERTPVARVQVDDGTGPRQMLVAPDGVVYDGHAYDEAMLGGLPWLGGFRLQRSPNGGFEPIAGMDAVASLLTTAQIEAPWLYREFRTVSLARLAERDELVVESAQIPEIVFHRRQDFLQQIARLDVVMDTYGDAARREGIATAMRAINLTGTQVAAEFEQSPAEIARQTDAARSRVNFNLQPSQQRKGGNDL